MEKEPLTLELRTYHPYSIGRRFTEGGIIEKHPSALIQPSEYLNAMLRGFKPKKEDPPESFFDDTVLAIFAFLLDDYDNGWYDSLKTNEALQHITNTDEVTIEDYLAKLQQYVLISRISKRSKDGSYLVDITPKGRRLAERYLVAYYEEKREMRERLDIDNASPTHNNPH